MPMPSSIQIGPIRYSVTTDYQMVRMMERETGFAHNRGGCQPNRGQIIIAPDTHPDMARDTLLHEILHALHDLYGWSVKDGDEQERQVDLLSTALLDTLRRNPDLVKYLTSDEVN